MAKLRTDYLPIATGVYVARRGDAIHVVTTGDGEPPVAEKDVNNVATKVNWLTEQEVGVAEFCAVVNTVSPEARGELVNVGTDEEPFLLTQQQAAQFEAVVARHVRHSVAARSRTAVPEKAS